MAYDYVVVCGKYNEKWWRIKLIPLGCIESTSGRRYT